MKALIYSGIGLFAVATAFGLVDYYGAKQTGTMDKLYKDDETEQAAVLAKETRTTEAKEIIAAAKTSKQEPQQIKTQAKDKSAKKQSRIKAPEIVVEPIIEDPITFDTTSITSLVPANSTEILKDAISTTDIEQEKVKEDKFEFKAEMFSRAPLKKRKVKK